MKRIIPSVALLLLVGMNFSFGQTKVNKNGYHLTHEITKEEKLLMQTFHKDYVASEAPAHPVRMVAEFEPMKGVYVAYDYSFGIPISAVVEMSEDDVVCVIVPNASTQTTVTGQLNSAGANMDNVEFLIAATDSWWARDYGPWFIIDGNGEFGVCNFPYNRPRPNDNNVPIHAANQMSIDLYDMNLTHTGGNYMCDGWGVGASTDLVMTENPSLSQDDINDLVYDYLGLTTYYLLDDPLGDYIEHIDCWGKFLDVDKVLLGQVAESDPRYADYEEVAEFFANQTSSFGTPYQVYRVFTPGGSYTTPYSNSLILNRKVYVPVEGNQYDDDAIAVYQEAMPGYEIIPVTSSEWYNTDALHCRTREMADIGMIDIRHIPYINTPAKGDYTIGANITAHSGQPLYADSIILNYRVNSGPFTQLVMSLIDSNYYAATIPQQEDGDIISYYIHAADESGRSVDNPYIGGDFDPNIFVIGDPAIEYCFLSDTLISLGETAERFEATYRIIGNNLLDDIQLDLLQGTAFSISLDGVDYVNELTIPQINGKVNETIHVRFDFLGVGEYTDSVVHSSTGLDNEHLSLFGDYWENVEELLHKSIKVYPNPSDGIIAVDGVENAVIEIFNTAGQMIVNQLVDRNLNFIDISNQEQGVYFVKIKTARGTITKKVVKY